MLSKIIFPPSITQCIYVTYYIIFEGQIMGWARKDIRQMITNQCNAMTCYVNSLIPSYQVRANRSEN